MKDRVYHKKARCRESVRKGMQKRRLERWKKSSVMRRKIRWKWEITQRLWSDTIRWVELPVNRYCSSTAVWTSKKLSREKSCRCHDACYSTVYLPSNNFPNLQQFWIFYKMDNELLQSFVRAGDNVPEEPEPSRLYQSPSPGQKARTKSERSDTKSLPAATSSQPKWRRREKVVIEQRFVRTNALAIDECYCDNDRAAAVSFGYLDIKYELKAKHMADKTKDRVERITPDDDSMAYYVLAIKEIKARNLENGMKFINKVQKVQTAVVAILRYYKRIILISNLFRPSRCRPTTWQR